MAELIPCPSCKKKISVEAQACPKCGQPITEEARTAGRKKLAEEKRAGGIGCIFFIIAAIAIAAWLGKTDSADKAATSPAAASQPAPTAQPDTQQPEAQARQAEPTFGITPKQFVNNFNKVAKEIDVEQRAKITKTSDASAQLTMSKFYAALLTLDSSGKVTSLMGIASGDGSATSGMEIMTGFLLSIAGVKPNWPPAYRGEVLKALMGKDKQIPKHAVMTKEGIKFSITLSEGVGIIFTAEPKK